MRGAARPSARFLATLAVAIAILSAGCIGTSSDPSSEETDQAVQQAPPDPVDPRANLDEMDATPLVAPYPNITTNLTEFQGSLSAGSIHAGWERTDVSWDYRPPGEPFGIDAYMDWDVSAADIGLEIVTPTGETIRDAPLLPQGNGDSVWETLYNPPAGNYTFNVLARGVTTPTDIDLEVDARVAESGWIETRQDDQEWIATGTWRDGTLSRPEMNVDLDTGRGDVTNTLRSRGAYVEATVHATGPNETAAEESLKQKDPWIEADDRKLRTRDFSSTDPRMDLELLVPPTSRISGSIDTDEGDVNVSGLTADGLTIEAEKGSVQANLTAVGDVEIVGSEGVVVDLLPNASFQLKATSDNGGVDLVLPRGVDVDLDLDVYTGVSPTTHLNGTRVIEEDGDYRLETVDPADDAVEITGKIEADGGPVVLRPRRPAT